MIEAYTRLIILEVGKKNNARSGKEYEKDLKIGCERGNGGRDSYYSILVVLLVSLGPIEEVIFIYIFSYV